MRILPFPSSRQYFACKYSWLGESSQEESGRPGWGGGKSGTALLNNYHSDFPLKPPLPPKSQNGQSTVIGFLSVYSRLPLAKLKPV